MKFRVVIEINEREGKWKIWEIIIIYTREYNIITNYICTRRSSRTPVGGEFRYYEHGAVEAQGSTGLRVDPVDAIQKLSVQHHQGEDNIRPVEGTVDYVPKTIDYEQGVFYAEIVQFTNMWRWIYCWSYK